MKNPMMALFLICMSSMLSNLFVYTSLYAMTAREIDESYQRYLIEKSKQEKKKQEKDYCRLLQEERAYKERQLFGYAKVLASDRKVSIDYIHESIACADSLLFVVNNDHYCLIDNLDKYILLYAVKIYIHGINRLEKSLTYLFIEQKILTNGKKLFLLLNKEHMKMEPSVIPTDFIVVLEELREAIVNAYCDYDRHSYAFASALEKFHDAFDYTA